MNVKDIINKDFFKRFMIGIILGIGTVIPGVSGGVLAASMGLYDKILESVSNLLKTPKLSIIFLFPLGLGVLLSVYTLSGVVALSLKYFGEQITFLFIGLVIGGMPFIVRNANKNGFKYSYLLSFLFGIILIFIIEFIGSNSSVQAITTDSLYSDVASGSIIAFGTIIPGISSSFILMSMGTYEKIMMAIHNIDIFTLVPAGIGFLVVAVLIIKIVHYIFKNFHGHSYYWVLGVLVSSTILVFPNISFNINMFVNIILFLAGFFAQRKLEKLV